MPVLLGTRMREQGITAIAKRSDKAPPEGFDPNATSWRVTLRNADGRRMAVPFHMGSAHTEPPEAADVLDCLLSDASLIENSQGFADWCSELGFEEDSRKAERIYKAGIRQTDKLRAFLGEAYSAFLWETERL